VVSVLLGWSCANAGSSPAGGGGTGTSASTSASAGGGGGGGAETVVVNPSIHNTVLGRPTDRSIAVSVLAQAAGDAVWVEYGTQVNAAGTELQGAQKTAAVTSTVGEPMVVDVEGLAADTRYFYRVHYQAGSVGDAPDNLHTFRTERAAGRSFHFGVQGDTHPERYDNKMFHADLFTLTMQAARDRQPDLYFMLGDDFSAEEIIQSFKDDNYGAGYLFTAAAEGSAPYSEYAALPHPFSQPMIVDGVNAPRHDAAYRELRERYLGLLANATSLFLVNGNHEQAHSASLGGIFNNAAIWAADGRLKYYPLPAPGPFYSVDTEKMTPVNGYPTLQAPDGLLRDYYAFTWGDALFVTIDPYWHAPKMPESTLYNGDGKKSSLWNATMGDAQYAWLRQTLETSSAKWKFVFTHHINGTGRGGASGLGEGEWGAATSELQANRPGWTKPIHQLLVDTKVTIFFQAHDHLFARETVDGVVYQAVPNPGDNSYFAYNCDAYAPASVAWSGPAGYGKYDATESVRMPNTGFLDVSVSAEAVRVAYVRTYRAVDLQTNPNGIFSGKEVNGEAAFTYSVPAQPGDDQAKDFAYACLGKAPPTGWVYNP
jgi:hypothetical protein